MILVRYLECELTECRTVSSEKYHRQTSHTATERAGEGSNIMGLQFDKVLKSDSNPSKFTNLFHRYLLCFTWLQISDKYSCNLQDDPKLRLSVGLFSEMLNMLSTCSPNSTHVPPCPDFLKQSVKLKLIWENQHKVKQNLRLQLKLPRKVCQNTY